MDPAAREFDRLPIDNVAGLPQSFPYLRDGVRYQFSMYVDVPEAVLGPLDEIMTLPDQRRHLDRFLDRFLVVRIDTVTSAGARRIVFLRKVVPSLQYRVGRMILMFPTQIVARRNLNGVGNFGTNIVGLVAS